MKTITSLDNSLIKKAVKIKNPRNRDNNKRCLVEGTRAVATFLQSPYTIARLYVTQAHLAWAQELCEERFIVLVGDQIMQKLSSAVTPSGVVGMFNIPEQLNVTELNEGIVLAQVQDPGNMGTLIRTATALNTTIVLVEGVNPYNQKVIQASAGTLAHARIIRCSWNELVSNRKKLKLGALVVAGGIPIEDIRHDSQPRLVIVGNEAHGLPHEWQNQCDEKITLPMPGGTESLNAAIAGSIALYLLHS